jgi:hypothetical protein
MHGTRMMGILRTSARKVRICNRIAALLGLVALAVTTARVDAQESALPSATGTWRSPGASWTIALTQRASKVTGTILVPRGAFTLVAAVRDGLVRGDTVSFMAESPVGGRIATFMGVMSSDSIVFRRSLEDPDGTIGGAGPLGARGPDRFTVARSAVGSDESGVPLPDLTPGSQRWVVIGGVVSPWIFDMTISDRRVSGVARQRSPGLAPDGTLAHYEFLDGVSVGDTIAFHLRSPEGTRVVAFRGIRRGREMDFTRSVAAAGGDPGGNGIVGELGPTRFTASLLTADATMRFQSRRAGRPAAAPTDAPHEEVRYRGFDIDVSAVAQQARLASILDAVRGQLDLIDGITLSDDVRRFFESVPLVLVAASGSASFDGTRVRIPVDSMIDYDRGHPVILHELCHAYHGMRLPDGFANADVLALYRAARDGGAFPAGAYMLASPNEYFGVMASVFLYGSAADEPHTRDEIRSRQPDMYRFLVKQFGPR